MSGSLTGRRAIVTGGGSGIGAAIVHRLAAAGAAVTVADRDRATAESIAQEVGGTAWVVDLSDLRELSDLELDCDILVNNAGFQHVSPVQDFDPHVFHTMIALMLESPFLLIRGALPHMYRNGFGRVINVTSVHGIRASPYKSAYVAAKHGLEGLSKAVALEGGAHGVTSVCISPGYVRTPLVEQQIASQARAHGLPVEDVVEKVLLAEPAVKRMLEPDEVADLAAWLCGESAGMATGTTFTLDGGWSAR